MSVQYQQLEDDIGAGDDCSTDSETSRQNDAESHISCPERQRSLQLLLVEQQDGKWPRKSGIAHLVCGVLLALLGIAQVVVLPLVFHMENFMDKPPFNATNNYGVALWAGILMVLSGSLGLRAHVFRSTRTIYVFFVIVLFNIAALSILMIVIASNVRKWKFKGTTAEEAVTLSLNIALCLGVGMAFLLTLHSFLRYYEDTCWGDLQLCRKFARCCLPCCCPRVVSPEERQEEVIGSERPPSLPV